MNRFEQTSIWQKTLGKQLEPDEHEKDREFLRVSFEKFREKAKILAGEIANDLPDFTVHDIDHIDALWETGELVTPKDLDLTPAEAFVLGGAFLVHDLGLGLASYTNGEKDLRSISLWKDTVSAVLKKKLDSEITEQDINSANTETKKIATEKVLRSLHAKHAEKLAKASWKNNEGEDTFLIENTKLRKSYGNVIGLIAHSHWWSVEDLDINLPGKLGAPGFFPPDWTVDPTKLACILRISDATQIDDRRAPYFLRTIRKPSDYSDQHWNFQQKIYQPRLERNRLVYTSKSPFTTSEIESWWICFDSLDKIDDELKQVDSLLADTNRQRLKAIGVAGVEDPKRLSKLITVKGWQPVDTRIKVTNVAELVNNLGGEQLYGNNLIVPLRELIQNSSDAIRARRTLEGETPEFGDIIVRIGEDSDGQYVEVEDNGVGMSKRVLTGPFLDFGESFWGTSLMHDELPGLESKGFSSTGKYGIGFFSVFMWGEKVKITTKRFEDGRNSTSVLEFNEGPSSRPILRKAEREEFIKDGGTRIRVWFSDPNTLEKLFERSGRRNYKITPAELIESLCPSLDCNIFLEENGNSKKIIEGNDWITIPSIELVKRIMGQSYYDQLGKKQKELVKKIAQNIQTIKNDEGLPVGRAALYQDRFGNKEELHLNGQVTIGGLKSSELSGLIGIFIGKSSRASRDIGLPVVSLNKIKKWASSQAKLLSKLNLNSEEMIKSASIIRRLGGRTYPLKIAHHKSGPVNYQELKKIINETNFDHYLVVHDASISIYEREYDKIDYYDNVFWVQFAVPGILQTRGRNDHHISWPPFTKKGLIAESLKGLIFKAFSESWNKSIDEIRSVADLSSDEREFEASVGEVDGKEAIIDHLHIIRKP